MQLGTAYQDALPASHREALFAAAELLSDNIVDGLIAFRDGSCDAKDSYLASMLPTRYLLCYTPAFMDQFHMCLLTVIWKLGQRKRIPLSCVGEELAAHLLIEEASAALKEKGEEADFGAFEDELFEDLDFVFLYDDAYDGIEDTAFGQSAGVTNLAFADWFTRFGPPDNDTYPEPHPLAWDATALVDMGEARADDTVEDENE